MWEFQQFFEQLNRETASFIKKKEEQLLDLYRHFYNSFIGIVSQGGFRTSNAATLTQFESAKEEFNSYLNNVTKMKLELESFFFELQVKVNDFTRKKHAELKEIQLANPKYMTIEDFDSLHHMQINHPLLKPGFNNKIEAYIKNKENQLLEISDRLNDDIRYLTSIITMIEECVGISNNEKLCSNIENITQNFYNLRDDLKSIVTNDEQLMKDFPLLLYRLAEMHTLLFNNYCLIAVKDILDLLKDFDSNNLAAQHRKQILIRQKFDKQLKDFMAAVGLDTDKIDKLRDATDIAIQIYYKLDVGDIIGLSIEFFAALDKSIKELGIPSEYLKNLEAMLKECQERYVNICGPSTTSNLNLDALLKQLDNTDENPEIIIKQVEFILAAINAEKEEVFRSLVVFEEQGLSEDKIYQQSFITYIDGILDRLNILRNVISARFKSKNTLDIEILMQRILVSFNETEEIFINLNYLKTLYSFVNGDWRLDQRLLNSINLISERYLKCKKLSMTEFQGRLFNENFKKVYTDLSEKYKKLLVRNAGFKIKEILGSLNNIIFGTLNPLNRETEQIVSFQDEIVSPIKVRCDELTKFYEENEFFKSREESEVFAQIIFDILNFCHDVRGHTAKADEYKKISGDIKKLNFLTTAGILLEEMLKEFCLVCSRLHSDETMEPYFDPTEDYANIQKDLFTKYNYILSEDIDVDEKLKNIYNFCIENYEIVSNAINELNKISANDPNFEEYQKHLDIFSELSELFSIIVKNYDQKNDELDITYTTKNNLVDDLAKRYFRSLQEKIQQGGNTISMVV